jgi:DNA-binding MarR family transcriptional regulator
MGDPIHVKEILKTRTIVLMGADRATSRGFTQVPNFILESPKISTGAKLTYAMLLKYAWHEDRCFPGQSRLAKDMGVTRKSVYSYIQELQDAELISVKRQGQGKTNVYTLHLIVDSHGKKRG